MNSNEPIRLGAAICVYDDHQWLRLVLDSIYASCDRIFALVGELPWNGAAVDNSVTVAVFESYPDPAGKIQIIRGPWGSETEQRNAGLEICSQQGCEICFVVDADEIYDPGELAEMVEIVRRTPQIDCFTVGLHTYWKSQKFRIDPPEPLQPPVFVRVGKATFTLNRAVAAATSALISPDVGVCHHMSYARTNSQIRSKLATFSHAHEIVPDWYTNVWLGWDRDPSMRHLHPTHPAAYHQAVQVPETSLPAPLQGLGDFVVNEIEPWDRCISKQCLAMDGSDLHAEAAAWQRYLYFRDWFDGRSVTDLGCGEGFGAAYISTFAESLVGIDADSHAVAHACRRYPWATFRQQTIESLPLIDSDLVICFDVIDRVSDRAPIIDKLSQSDSAMALSYSRIETEEMIQTAFAGRSIRTLYQQSSWPYRMSETEVEQPLCKIAVVDAWDLPHWPSVGISIPTMNANTDLVDAVISMSRSYPGRVEFAIAANGCTGAAMETLEKLQSSLPDAVHLVQLDRNYGYGIGANRGLEALKQLDRFEYFAVSNDDVIPATDCLAELVRTMQHLESIGNRPGVVGPVSNIVNGSQQVELGSMESYAEMIYRADRWRVTHHDAAFQTSQVRGLFMLIHPDCLHVIGGFDPIFGLGNCEDDDHNVRAQFAGFTLWVSEGAFLYHSGSQTFKALNTDYRSLVQHNAELFSRKWNAVGGIEGYSIAGMPEGMKLHVPLDAGACESVLNPAA